MSLRTLVKHSVCLVLLLALPALLVTIPNRRSGVFGHQRHKARPTRNFSLVPTRTTRFLATMVAAPKGRIKAIREEEKPSEASNQNGYYVESPLTSIASPKWDTSPSSPIPPLRPLRC